MNSRFDYTILDAINNAFRTSKAAPLVLGATSSGAGGPPGGYVGYLYQGKVSYDPYEVASSGVPESGISLIDNLNHIRYRLGVIESGGAGASSFLDLTDTPNAYTGQTGKAVIVNVTEDGLEFGTVSSATALSGLTDVSFTGEADGDTLVRDGANWINVPIYSDTKDPTGWVDPTNVNVSYDATARTVTLTPVSGTLQYYWHGIKHDLGATWTSEPHDTPDGGYFLYSSDGTNITWSTDAWTFDMLMVAKAIVSTTPAYKFAIKEAHGMMPWQVHQELHDAISAYRTSGGALTVGTYTENTATDSANSPGFDAAVIKDEDNSVTIPAWTEGTYTTMRIGAGGKATFDTTATVPFRSAGINNYIYINNTTTGAETPSTNNKYVNVYQVLIPAAIDTDSQKYRMVMLQPQRDHPSLADAQLENPQNLSFGDLASTTPEFVIYARITYVLAAGDTTNAGKARIATGGISYITGSRLAQTSISGLSNHEDLSGLLGGGVDDHYHLTGVQASGLINAGDTALHYHLADRARAVHTGTQTASTISDFTEAAQDAVGGMVDTSLVYVDATPTLQRAALTGDVTASAGSNATTIANDAVTFAKMQNIATDTLLGRDTASTGDVESISLNGTLSMTGAGALQRAALTGAITASAGSNTTALGSFTTAQLNTALSDNDIATGGGTATGTNTGDETTSTIETKLGVSFDTPLDISRILTTSESDATVVRVTDQLIFSEAFGIQIGDTQSQGMANVNLYGNTGNASAPNTSAAAVILMEYEDVAGNGALFKGYTAGGTKATPTAVPADRNVAVYRGAGYGGTGAVIDAGSTGGMDIVTNQTQTATNKGTRLDFYTTPNNTATRVKAFTVGADGNVNIATGKTYNINGAAHTHDAIGGYSTTDLFKRFAVSPSDLSGGGTISFSGTALSWTQRFIWIPNGTTGGFFATAGTGTLSGLAAWHIIYAVVTDADWTTAAQVIVTPVSAGYTTYVPSPNHIILGFINGDTINTLHLANGIRINAGQTYSTKVNSSAIAPTVTTNANLTGDVTSVGNATAIASDVIVNADIKTDAAIALSKLASIATDSLLGRDTAASGAIENITLNATLSMTGTGALQRAALTGDVTASAGSNTTAIAAGVIVDADVNASAAIALSKLATQAANTMVVNATAGTAVPTAVAVAANQFLARSSTGNIAAKSITDFGLSLIDDAAASNARTTLGLRTILTDNTTIIYVATTGNDSTGTGASGAPYLTIQKAYDILCSNYDTAGYTITIQIAAGTNYAGLNVNKGWTGGGQVVIQGATTNGTLYGISTTGDHCVEITAALPAPLTIKDMTLTAATSGNCLYHNGLGELKFGNIYFGAVPQYYFHILAEGNGAKITCISAYAITGGGGDAHWACTAGGALFIGGVTCTVTNTPNFLYCFLYATRGSLAQCPSMNFSGAFTAGITKYRVELNSVFYAYPSSPSYLPGSVAGATATGGQTG